MSHPKWLKIKHTNLNLTNFLHHSFPRVSHAQTNPTLVNRKFKILIKWVSNSFKDLIFSNSNFRHTPGDPTNYKVLVNNATTVIGVVSGVITSHKEKLASDPAAPREDFIDHYLDKISEGKEVTNTGMLSINHFMEIYCHWFKKSFYTCTYMHGLINAWSSTS